VAAAPLSAQLANQAADKPDKRRAFLATKATPKRPISMIAHVAASGTSVGAIDQTAHVSALTGVISNEMGPDESPTRSGTPGKADGKTLPAVAAVKEKASAWNGVNIAHDPRLVHPTVPTIMSNGVPAMAESKLADAAVALAWVVNEKCAVSQTPNTEAQVPSWNATLYNTPPTSMPFMPVKDVEVP